jgi:flagellar biogenesis protein FliO
MINLLDSCSRLASSALTLISIPILLLAADPAWAAPAESAAVHVETPSLVFSLVRVVGALALVFALFLAGVWLFRNWQRLAGHRGQTPKLNVLEVKSLGARHALYVIGYEQQRFLLSSAPTGISLLTPLPPVSGVEAQAPALPQPTFAETLARVLAPRNGAHELDKVT